MRPSSACRSRDAVTLVVLPDARRSISARLMSPRLTVKLRSLGDEPRSAMVRGSTRQQPRSSVPAPHERAGNLLALRKCNGEA